MLKLKQIRKKKRLTQEEFSEILGISQNFLSELENGASCSTKKLIHFSQILNIPIDKLIQKIEVS